MSSQKSFSALTLSWTGTALLTCLSITACSSSDAPKSQARELMPSQRDRVARGEYLVTTSGCHDCHSPKVMTEHGPEPDPNRLMSGHPSGEALPPVASTDPRWIAFSMGLTATVGPWGVSHAANLTPDDTGIGTWSFEQFETAIRRGKSKGLVGARDLLPPMPWPMYKHFNDEDLRSIFAYLKSLKPVKNLVPAPIPPGAAPQVDG
ncbi:MAG: c-type cytochrome [Myxococcales bacterium]